jgi:hypothetical protein
MALLHIAATIVGGTSLHGFALFLSITSDNGEPVTGLGQNDIMIDTLGGNVQISEVTTHFLAPKPGFYIVTVTLPASLELKTSQVFSITVVHKKEVGGADYGQTIATLGA